MGTSIAIKLRCLLDTFGPDCSVISHKHAVFVCWTSLDSRLAVQHLLCQFGGEVGHPGDDVVVTELVTSVILSDSHYSGRVFIVISEVYSTVQHGD